jgi:hypothetical protein
MGLVIGDYDIRLSPGDLLPVLYPGADAAGPEHHSGPYFEMLKARLPVRAQEGGRRHGKIRSARVASIAHSRIQPVLIAPRIVPAMDLLPCSPTIR